MRTSTVARIFSNGAPPRPPRQLLRLERDRLDGPGGVGPLGRRRALAAPQVDEHRLDRLGPVRRRPSFTRDRREPEVDLVRVAEEPAGLLRVEEPVDGGAHGVASFGLSFSGAGPAEALVAGPADADADAEAAGAAGSSAQPRSSISKTSAALAGIFGGEPASP